MANDKDDNGLKDVKNQIAELQKGVVALKASIEEHRCLLVKLENNFVGVAKSVRSQEQAIVRITGSPTY